jgi:hypothetical protein
MSETDEHSPICSKAKEAGCGRVDEKGKEEWKGMRQAGRRGREREGGKGTGRSGGRVEGGKGEGLIPHQIKKRTRKTMGEPGNYGGEEREEKM